MSVPVQATRGRTVAALTLVVVVIGSALGGAALDRVYLRKSTRIVGDTAFHPLSSALRTPSDADRRQIRDELSAALTLTPEQARVIDSIMRQRSGQFEDLRGSIRPRVESLLADLRADVEKVLTPEQRDKYRKLRGVPASDARDR
jgi:hypothetical protein